VSGLRAGLPILGFASAAEWEAWLAAQPESSKGLWLKLAKKGAGAPSLTRQQAIDGALCHGWIDGQINKYDAHFWLVRFTPRKPASRWSEINRAKATELIAQGRMRPRGLRQVELAKADGRWDAAYAGQGSAAVPDDLDSALKRSPKARASFDALSRQNRYAILYRIHAVKQAKTREARIAKYVAMLERGETIYPEKKTKAASGKQS
jgi:uncharacterized protein YdeI (YjbR/CyaY-like superfamily)